MYKLLFGAFKISGFNVPKYLNWILVFIDDVQHKSWNVHFLAKISIPKSSFFPCSSQKHYLIFQATFFSVLLKFYWYYFDHDQVFQYFSGNKFPFRSKPSLDFQTFIEFFVVAKTNMILAKKNISKKFHLFFCKNADAVGTKIIMD